MGLDSGCLSLGHVPPRGSLTETSGHLFIGCGELDVKLLGSSQNWCDVLSPLGQPGFTGYLVCN